MIRLRAVALFFALAMLLSHAVCAEQMSKRDGDDAPGARWIWRDGGDPAPRNAFTYFRTRVYLKSIPRDATLHFAADSNAHVWVNGQILERKMTRYFEPSIRTMVLDPKPFLHRGWNTIVVLHHSWGPIVTFQRSAAMQAGVYLRSSWVHSDSSWTFKPAPEYEAGEDQIRGVTGDHRVRYPEVLNGPLIDSKISGAEFDDSQWHHAVVVAHGPWPATPQDVETEPQQERSVLPKRVVASGTLSLSGPLPQRAIDIAHSISEANYTPSPTMTVSAKQLLSGGTFTLSGRRGESRYITVDFDLPVHGFPEITLNASSKGDILDFGYGELAFSQYSGKRYVRSNGWIDPERVVGHGYADRYITAAGKQHFEMPDERTARWLSVLVHFQHDGEITFSRIGFVSSMYPVKVVGTFVSGDAEIDRIMELAMRHARVSMSDVYVDTPGREDGMWIEDARPRAELSARWFGDHRLRQLFLRLVAESQRDNGNFHPFPPASYPIRQEGFYDWTVEWAGALYDEYDWTGNVDGVNVYWPQLVRLWTLLLSRMGDDGLWRSNKVLADIRVGEHPRSDEESSSIVSAQLIARLRESIQLAHDTHHVEEEQAWVQAVHKMEDAFRRDHVVPETNGVPAHVADVIATDASSVLPRGYSQAAQVMAMLANLVPNDLVEQDLGYAFTQPDGSPHAGVARWNNPTYAYRTLRALSDSGHADLAVRHLRERYGAYLSGDPRNHNEAALQGSLGGPLPEYFISREDLQLKEGELDTAQPVDETGSHGWGAVPLLWAHDTLLGVRIAQPGGGRLDIAPHDAGLPYVAGTTFTPHGRVTVDWRPSLQRLTLAVPKEVAIRVALPGSLRATHLQQLPKGCVPVDEKTILCDGTQAFYRFTSADRRPRP